MGVTCLLASGSASEYTTAVTGGIQVKVHSDKVGLELVNCKNWYDAICLTTSG